MTLILLLTLACAAPDGACGEIIAVTTTTTSDDEGEDVDVGEPCTVVDTGNGNVDVTGCCPDGYTFLAMGGDPGTVLCEEDCQ